MKYFTLKRRKKMFSAATEWVCPENFPDLKEHKYIAIDLETRDPNLKSRG